MAYPSNITAPYGFRPMNEIGGLPYAGSTRMIPIATNAGAMYFGDVVQLTTIGTVKASTMSAESTPGTAVNGTIGIFVGCEYTALPSATAPNPSGPLFGKMRAQFFPGSTYANDAVAYVVDDPRVVLKAVMLSAGTALSNTSSTIAYASPSFIGSNLNPVFGGSGSTATGNSAQGVCGAVVTNGTGGVRTTSALPFRVVGVVPETAVTVQTTGTTSGSSATVTVASSTGLVAGMQVIAQVAATGAYVSGASNGSYLTLTNVNGTTLTVSSAINIGSTAANLTFIGYPEVLVTWNGSFHSYNNTTGATVA